MTDQRVARQRRRSLDLRWMLHHYGPFLDRDLGPNDLEVLRAPDDNHKRWQMLGELAFVLEVLLAGNRPGGESVAEATRRRSEETGRSPEVERVRFYRMLARWQRGRLRMTLDYWLKRVPAERHPLAKACAERRKAVREALRKLPEDR